jgi:hypothetical protein
MDQHGTRGVGAMQQQVIALVATVSRLDSDTRAWQRDHQKEHTDDAKARVAGRRWLIGTCLAGVAVIVTLLGVILAHLPPR